MRLIFILLLTGLVLKAQTIAECKERFTRYINFNNSLTHLIRFNEESITIYAENGKLEFTAWKNELPLLAAMFENKSITDLEKFYKAKGNRKLSIKERDSLLITIDNPIKGKKNNTTNPLKGLKIAIDPGHLAGNFQEAMKEQKYLCFVRDSVNFPLDTIKIFESELTFKTALITKAMIEEQGGTVMLSRPEIGLSSFGCSYSDWYKLSKHHTLDSLKNFGIISVQEHQYLLKLNEYDFFWKFFRDYELLNRAHVINSFRPDATLIIHYNVDEKNEPWKKCSPHNFTMAFVGGACTPAKLQKTESKMNLLRMLFTKQLNQSELLAGFLVKEFNQQLNVPIAKESDASYLKKNCVSLPTSGVYSRQLILCNTIRSPLVYGECLYQDNEKECLALFKNDEFYYGVQTNKRVYTAAKGYVEALYGFFSKN